MPEAIKAYVRWVDRLNRAVGLLAMYLVFAMLAILLYSSISKTFFDPSLWTLEMAQFTMVAYYLLGGGRSMQLDAHVRMDLLYSRWSARTQACVDAITILFPSSSSQCCCMAASPAPGMPSSTTRKAIQHGRPTWRRSRS
jgi:TRAP-type mannitol/chloroaromatic compound transport system permease small subunit